MIFSGLNKAYKILFVILLLGLYVVVCINNPNKDFDIFIGASQLVQAGKTCYEVWLHSGSSGLKYFYSPLFAVILFPINHSPQIVYNSVWFVFNLFFLWRLCVILQYFLPESTKQIKNKQWLIALSILAVSRFVFDNLQLGQMNIFLVWGSLEAWHLNLKNQKIAAAAILALIINIKLIPLAILVLFIYMGEFKTAVLTIMFVLVSLFLPGLIIGFDFNFVLLGDWQKSILSTNNSSILDDYGRQSLSAFIPALFMDTPIQFNLKRNVLSLEPSTVKLILSCVRLGLLLLVALLLGKPFKSVKNKHEALYALALVCLCTPLIFPHQGKYAFFYLLPAYTYVISSLDQIPKKTSLGRQLILPALSFILLTLSTDGLIGRYLSDYCEYLNFITIGSLFLVGQLIIFRPSKINPLFD